MRRYRIQWYDFATHAWRNHGPTELSSETAKEYAYDLYMLKEQKIDLRVIPEEVIWEISKK